MMMFKESTLDLLGGNLLQGRGIISLIPKSEENLNEITCWCPITLLNADYKILARIIATHITPSLLS